MELDHFKTAWQQQPLEGAALRSREDIMQDVRRRAAQFNRQIRQRDLLETLAGIIVIPAFAYIAWTVPQTLAKAGALIVVAGCVQVIARLYLARTRNQPPSDASAREFCALELKRLEAQIRLLSSVAWWYIAPLLGGSVIFVLGVEGPASARVATLLLLSIGAVVIYWINRQAVRRRLQPMADDLARIVRDMAQ